MAKTELFVRRTPGGVLNVVREDICTGDIWFVNSATGTNEVGYGKSPDAPFDTLAYAVASGGVAVGDRVYLMQGHTEDVTAAGTITLNKAGLEVIGLGRGARRPVINWTTVVGATLAISGEGTAIRNVKFDLTGVDAVTTGINVTGADVEITDCVFNQADAGGQAERSVTIGAAAHNFKFLRNYVLALNDGGVTCLYHAGGATDVVIADNNFYGDWNTAVYHNDTALQARLNVLRNVFNVIDAAGLGFVVHADTTGNAVGNHLFVTANIAAGGSYTAAKMFKSENYEAENAHIAGSTQVGPAAGGYA